MIYECQCEFVSEPCRLSFNASDSAQLNYRTNLCPAGFFSRCRWEERPQNNVESAVTDMGEWEEIDEAIDYIGGILQQHVANDGLALDAWKMICDTVNAARQDNKE